MSTPEQKNYWTVVRLNRLRQLNDTHMQLAASQTSRLIPYVYQPGEWNKRFWQDMRKEGILIQKKGIKAPESIMEQALHSSL